MSDEWTFDGLVAEVRRLKTVMLDARNLLLTVDEPATEEQRRAMSRAYTLLEDMEFATRRRRLPREEEPFTLRST